MKVRYLSKFGEKNLLIKSINSILLSTVNQEVSKKEIEKALALLPLQNTVPVQHLRAPSYLYAILMDGRISQNEW